MGEGSAYYPANLEGKVFPNGWRRKGRLKDESLRSKNGKRIGGQMGGFSSRC